MSLYRYYCKYRPPMPGGIPREGLIYVHSYDNVQSVDGVTAWGYVEYSRKLTEREVDDYELVASKQNPIYFE